MYGKIYKIISPQTDKIYIGSTIKKLNTRLSQHKMDYKRFLNGRYANVSSFEIVKFDDCYIELLELFEYNSKNELLIREGYYIKLNENNVINKNIAGQTRQEYRLKHRDKINESKNDILLCECGRTYTRTNKSHHVKSIKHLNFINQNI